MVPWSNLDRIDDLLYHEMLHQNKKFIKRSKIRGSRRKTPKDGFPKTQEVFQRRKTLKDGFERSQVQCRQILQIHPQGAHTDKAQLGDYVVEWKIGYVKRGTGGPCKVGGNLEGSEVGTVVLVQPRHSEMDFIFCARPDCRAQVSILANKSHVGPHLSRQSLMNSGRKGSTTPITANPAPHNLPQDDHDPVIRHWIHKDMGQPNDQTPSKPELRAGQNGTRDRGRMMKIGGLDDTMRQVMRERTALVFGDRQRDEGSGPDQRCDGSDGSGLRIGVIGATERRSIRASECGAPEHRSVGVRSAGVSERGAQRTGGPE
ncbi:hypothetical protein C8F04DRAFT_1322762 [Mycena alexandri]|uniref:Uncharacterized protein n=1 Tax=Mycena alexandri TaxID=1745969 RepID=A0AAD6TIW3_9AGAR|nr:hypothetical protein C8F04DRAFT_1322762 [Mycena alexandri]